eukprot:4428766-Pleurochrysis_carterae.AAC.2
MPKHLPVLADHLQMRQIQNARSRMMLCSQISASTDSLAKISTSSLSIHLIHRRGIIPADARMSGDVFGVCCRYLRGPRFQPVGASLARLCQDTISCLRRARIPYAWIDAFLSWGDMDEDAALALAIALSKAEATTASGLEAQCDWDGRCGEDGAFCEVEALEEGEGWYDIEEGYEAKDQEWEREEEGGHEHAAEKLMTLGRAQISALGARGAARLPPGLGFGAGEGFGVRDDGLTASQGEAEANGGGERLGSACVVGVRPTQQVRGQGSTSTGSRCCACSLSAPAHVDQRDVNREIGAGGTQRVGPAAEFGEAEALNNGLSEEEALHLAVQLSAATGADGSATRDALASENGDACMSSPARRELTELVLRAACRWSNSSSPEEFQTRMVSTDTLLHSML